MSETLHCAVCGNELTTADADMAVPTDEGLVHRECYEGETSPVDEIVAENERAENERRREHGDPPLPDAERYEQMMSDFCPPACGHVIHDAMAAAVQGGPPSHVGFNSNHGPTRWSDYPFRMLAVIGAPMTDEEYPDPRSFSPRVRGRHADAAILDSYDHAEARAALMERDQRWYGGRYDSDGLAY